MSLVVGYQIALPFNQPKLLPAVFDVPFDPMKALPTEYISFAQSPLGSYEPPVRHRSTKGRNIWMPESLYWSVRPRINIPYIPFLSNCKGYGQHIPLWGLIEQHYGCELVAREETLFMEPYSFGEEPTADACAELVIPCVYDEIFESSTSMVRWFEVGGETPLFDISIDPVAYGDLMARDFTDLEILAVAPDPGVDDEGVVPKNIAFEISYFQVDDTNKKLISTGLAYENAEELTEREALGDVRVDYNLTFTFSAFAHTDLLVSFAFPKNFYLVLYCGVGLMSIAITFLFLVLHWLMARPRRSSATGEVAKFKFYSYFILTIPPAANGFAMAMLPTLLADFFISIVICGYFVGTPTFFFPAESCNSTEGVAGCALTILDVIPPATGAWAVNYKDLRTGRAGVALIATGYYLMLAAMKIIIPDQTSWQKGVPAAYDGNIWEFYTWKRSNMVFVSIFVVFLCLVVIQFSFSELFGLRIWFSIAGLKIV